LDSIRENFQLEIQICVDRRYFDTNMPAIASPDVIVRRRICGAISASKTRSGSGYDLRVAVVDVPVHRSRCAGAGAGAVLIAIRIGRIVMSSRRRTILVAAIAALLPAAGALAGSYQLLPGVFITDMTPDGSVVVGNTQGNYETFRWTQSTGVVNLGRGTVATLGVGAGLPGVSADGTRISATILDDSATAATQGVWTLGSGWKQIMPPTLPDGGILDQSYGSAWSISGDGSTVTGLYWRPGQTGGLAHASRWTQASGVSDLGSLGGASSRASAVNYDGTVIGGFDEHPSFGVRRAAIWDHGVETIIVPESDAPSEIAQLTPAGTTAVGQSWDDVNFFPSATVWKKTGGSWNPSLLGVLPGTDSTFGGSSSANDLSADGQVVVGTNSFDFFGSSAGFIWTAADGMVNANEWLPAHGITIDPNLYIVELDSISQDGTTIGGLVQDQTTFALQSILISVPEPSSAVLVVGMLAGASSLRARRRGR
jgi:uncharacterized membrane protein